ncbi:hypothetical protein AB870_22850 [Pandoraea faecigallinarum]|uniref:Uncharacterized protein n=1 Tax=Pandoraea faecigallinarum TaxID=656179 RepID=A0A0H3WXG8_9BURK|nr:hypothetical protein [Pandoraea faecigallinarum]AKM32330.1 hypothetical protein AB870_22850 [Pandoraea faecigallinarum]
MTRLHLGTPHHAHRPASHFHGAPQHFRRTVFVDDWRGNRSSRRRNGQRAASGRRADATMAPEAGTHALRPGVSHAAFALSLLALTSLAASASGARRPERSNALPEAQSAMRPAMPSQSHLSAGVFGLLTSGPGRDVTRDVDTVCLPPADMQPLGVTRLASNGTEALRAGRTAYRRDVQRALAILIRDAVAACGSDTREAFANAEVLIPFRTSLIVDHAGGRDLPAQRVMYDATHAIVLMLRSPAGEWRQYALSLSGSAPGLVSPLLNCVPRHTFWPRCFAQTHGATLWGDNWPSIASRIAQDDDLRFWDRRAGASISPGWPSANATVLDSPDLDEVAELLLDTVQQHLPRDRRHAPGDASGARLPRQAQPDKAASIDEVRGLAARMTMAGFGCLAAVVHPDSLRHDAIALLSHLWPETAREPAQGNMADPVAKTLASQHGEHVTYEREPFDGPLGRGVQWILPPDTYVEYRPDLTQNGVQVFDVDGVLYGATVAHTRKHASHLRPLDEIRAEAGPHSLCRISRGMGTDVDGMCLECHSERAGQVTVTEQGATVTQHQIVEASPVLRLRVAIYAQTFEAADGARRFFAFGRLGEFDEDDMPHVRPEAPRVDASVYLQTLDGELAFFEQATTDGPVGGRRVHLVLGGMRIAVPFGTYRDAHGILHGVAQVSQDVYYRFALAHGDAGATRRHVRLSRRDAQDRDIREYWRAQRHRAAAENAIVLPTISYGETRTLLQLYLRMWEQSPSPAAVWRGLEDVPLTVSQARRAVSQLARAIEHRVASARAAREGAGEVDDLRASPPHVDPALLPTFHQLWSHWQRYPAQADAFVNAIARDFVSRPSPLAVWSQLPFTGDVQTTRNVLSLFEEVFPRMSGLQALVTGRARAARDVQERLRELSRNANIALAEVTLVDGTRTIYYCLSGLQRATLPTNAPGARLVDAGRAYAQREHSVIAQRRGGAAGQRPEDPTEPPALRLVMADANLPTYHAASGEAKARTLDTERLILAQIYMDHPAGEGVVRSIVMCSRMPFCDSCAVNLAMTPYHYPDAELRFYYVAPSPRDKKQARATPATVDAVSDTRPAPSRAPGNPPGASHAHVHSTL